MKKVGFSQSLFYQNIKKWNVNTIYGMFNCGISVFNKNYLFSPQAQIISINIIIPFISFQLDKKWIALKTVLVLSFKFYLSLAQCNIIENQQSRMHMQVVDWIIKQTGKISDNFNDYKFYVRHEPTGIIDSSTTISLTSFASREQSAIIPCSFRWFRLKNGILTQVPEFKGNSFICEPSDVGSIIQAQILSSDPEHPGTALLKYGPVKLDVLLKKSIQSALSSGASVMNIDLLSKDQVKQCEFHIFEDSIKIQHCNSSASYKFTYNIGQPIFDVMLKDPTRISISFNEKYQSETLRFIVELFSGSNLTQSQRLRNETRLQIRFPSRKAKDEFIFIMKAFNTKREMKNSVVINKIQRLDFDKQNFDYVLEIESLRSDLRKLYDINNKQKLDKKVYIEENQKLQKEIEEIIVSYTRIIQGKFKSKDQFEQSFIDFENKKDEAIAHKYKRIEEQNQRLKEYLKTVTDAEGHPFHISDFKDQLRVPNDSHNPFSKKRSPFEQIKGEPYDKILNNLNISGEQMLLLDQNNDANELKMENVVLEEKLNRSFHTIQKLERKIKKYQNLNQSAIYQYGGDLNQSLNKSVNRGNVTALEISTGLIVQQKIELERKYKKLKEDHQKLKEFARSVKDVKKDGEISKEGSIKGAEMNLSDFNKKYIKDESMLLQNTKENPEFGEQAKKCISGLRNKIKMLQKQKQLYISQIDQLSRQLREEKDSKESIKSKLQKKVPQLKTQIQLLRRNQDVLNRSQHLSMEMDDYNDEQNKTLKEQNEYLIGETQKLTKMCEKYKTEYKKLKESSKLNC